MNMIHKISFLFIVLLLFGCENKKDFTPKDIYDINKQMGKSGNKVIDTLKSPKHLREIITDISLINTYQTGILAKGQTTAQNFNNYKKLEKEASEKELIDLTDNKNDIVSLYSSIILLNKNFENIDKVFLKLLDKNKTVETEDGCIVESSKAYIPFYRKYFYSLNDENVVDNKLLKKMDSLIIYHKNANDEILQQVLSNRLYSSNFNTQIEKLAFVENKESAILYLSKWYKAKYKEQLQPEIIRLFKQDSLNAFFYKKYLQELLSFNNAANRKIIINKLKKDTTWKIDEFEFYNLLQRNGISISDIDQ